MDLCSELPSYFVFAVMKSSMSLAEKHLSARQLKYKSPPDPYSPHTLETRISNQSRYHWQELLEYVRYEASRFKDVVDARLSAVPIAKPPAVATTSAVTAATTSSAGAATGGTGTGAGAAEDKLMAPSLDICKQRLTNLVDDDWVTLSRRAQHDVDDMSIELTNHYAHASGGIEHNTSSNNNNTHRKKSVETLMSKKKR